MNKQAQRSRPEGPEDEDIQATGKRVRTISEMKEEQKKDRFDRSQDLPPMEEILLGVRRIEVDSQPSGDEVFDEIDGKRKPRSHYKQRHDELHRNDFEKLTTMFYKIYCIFGYIISIFDIF